MIIPIGAEHVEKIARLHCAELTGLLSELGEAAARAYYSGGIRASAAVGFVDMEQGEVRGFVLGSVHPDRLKRAILRDDPLGTLGGTLLGVIRNPRALPRVLTSFRGPDEGGFDAGAPELTYLAVSAKSRKRGIGGSLVDAFTRAMRDAGVPAYELSVDDDNARARALYEGRGFEAVGSYREFGTRHRRYRLRISPINRDYQT